MDMRFIYATALCAALAACDAPTAPTAGQAQPDASPVMAIRSNAGPGASITPATLVGKILRDACLATRPAFNGAESALVQAGGFVQNAQTKTYYHQTHNLSVKVVPGRCSVVTAARAGQLSQTRETILNTTGDRVSIKSGLPRQLGNKWYMSFFVEGGS